MYSTPIGEKVETGGITSKRTMNRAKHAGGTNNLLICPKDVNFIHGTVYPWIASLLDMGMEVLFVHMDFMGQVLVSTWVGHGHKICSMHIRGYLHTCGNHTSVQ